jgi:hypothetical protein
LALYISVPAASATRSRPDAAAVIAGLRPTKTPSLREMVAFGCFFHAFDGQNTNRPSSETSAGTSVSDVTSMTPTPIASAGPSDPKNPSDASSSTRNATTTAPAADAMTSPTRSTETTIAVFLSSPARRRSRYRNRMNRM